MLSQRLLTLLIFLSVLNSCVGQELCACRFNVPPEDEAGCRVYGQLGDRVLIPWFRGSQECMDTYNIKVRAIDEQTLSLMCPNGDGSGASASSFVNFLRFTGSAASNGIKLSYPQFFTEEPGTTRVVFTDTITDDSGATLDCDANESACWKEVRDFFSENPSELAKACIDLFNRQANDLELEQSTLRIRLCQEMSTSECEPLWGQIDDFATDSSNDPPRACSAYGLGPAGLELPCVTEGSTDTSASVQKSSTFTLGVLAMMFALIY